MCYALFDYSFCQQDHTWVWKLIKRGVYTYVTGNMFAKYKQCHTEVNQGHIIGSNKLNIFWELLLWFRFELKYKIKVIFARHDIVLNVYATWLDRHAVRQFNLTLMWPWYDVDLYIYRENLCYASLNLLVNRGCLQCALLTF